MEGVQRTQKKLISVYYTLHIVSCLPAKDSLAVCSLRLADADADDDDYEEEAGHHSVIIFELL